MAIVSFKADLDASGAPSAGPNYAGALTTKTSVDAIDYTAFAAALATLVADGATPTQGHVNTANSAWTTLKGLIDAAIVVADAQALIPATGVRIAIDTTTVPTVSKLQKLFREIANTAAGSGLLTS